MPELTTTWRTLNSLPAGDRRVALHAAALLVAIRLALMVIPFRRLRTALDRLGGPGPSRPGPAPDPARIRWAVLAVGRHLPLTRHCLTQALAGQVLLARAGRPSDLRIGLARSESGAVHGHAWLELDGEVLIGGPEASAYRPVSSFGGGPVGDEVPGG